MEPLVLRVLEVFREMERDRLDLHTLFEAGGNEPLHRVQGLDAIVNLTREGMLEASGGDFYSLTERGKGVISNLSDQ